CGRSLHYYGSSYAFDYW
nr:immunoglobulin heavy chain junction region [Mus musculus]